MQGLDPFVSGDYLSTHYGPGGLVSKHDHKKNEDSLTKMWDEKDFKLDLDYIIEIKPKPPKLIEYFQNKAKSVNEQYFQV